MAAFFYFYKMNIETWKNKGQFVDINKYKIFYISNIIDNQKPVLCFMHGYPSCSYDYIHALPWIEKEFNYVIHDHIGFGLSEKPKNYAYSLIEQAEISIAFWQKLGLKEIHIIAHDYSTTVANEILYRKMQGFQSIKIKSITFCNGSMDIHLAKLRLVQKLLKNELIGKYIAAMMNKSMYIRNMKAIWYDKNKFDQKEIELLYYFLMHQSCTEVLHKISTYNNDRARFWHRWIPIFKDADIPIHFLWAQQDPIAVKAIAETLHKATPHSTYTKIEACGHYPMLEKPETWTKAVLDFITKI